MTRWTKLYRLSSINGSYKGVAKTLTNYSHQREATELNSDIFNFAPFQNVTSLKGANSPLIVWENTIRTLGDIS